MCAQKLIQSRSIASRIEGPLTWLGGGDWRQLGEHRERSNHAVAGAVVAFGAALAWLVASVAIGASTRVPMPAVVALTLVFGLMVGAVTRGTASGPRHGWPGTVGRAAVAVAVGVVVGELAALVLFSGPIEQRLDQRAFAHADSSPAVARVSASLQRSQAARLALDNAVQQARENQDKALVVARCEYHPTPACPQTRITGVPGAGPETRTANELLSDAQHELDDALAARDRQAPALDAEVARGEQALAAVRQQVVADAGRGLGPRWVALNELTSASGATLALRALTIALFALLYLLPLILRQWRGETTEDRHTTARADRERAELEADTAIAIKRAEVRRAAEIMWAEHQLTQARLAIEAQAEIDREQQRRRVVEALEPPMHADTARAVEAVGDDMYLPIAAEAEAAASRAAAELPASAGQRHDSPQNLPAPAQPGGAPSIPSIPDATAHLGKAAARWIRPLVPPLVGRVIDNTTQPLTKPLRTARQVFEDVEEIAFSFKRTRKITVNTESSDVGEQPQTAAAAPGDISRIESSRGEPHRTFQRPEQRHEPARLPEAPRNDLASLSAGRAERTTDRELAGRDGPRELRAPEGPRQLPPAD
ncbi:DUF4407 domain-containing protein [Mycobacterium conspicuum]|jgi:hypothetical protein|uniref:Membrane protein n=1 Tax=Mycobacterium conspicuum TaxID=44010 RepID=A0A1X1SSI7_9MYCO|nr:DUF4407 domain-containing protein [Mycobacterium conspicuum]ORV33496.1 hypothetical protein AWC00_28140 [Mycobacterium conspicuum]BBZ39560.1 membrane protein [Mycobacterium conspicuum]